MWRLATRLSAWQILDRMADVTSPAVSSSHAPRQDISLVAHAEVVTVPALDKMFQYVVLTTDYTGRLVPEYAKRGVRFHAFKRSSAEECLRLVQAQQREKKEEDKEAAKPGRSDDDGDETADAFAERSLILIYDHQWGDGLYVRRDLSAAQIAHLPSILKCASPQGHVVFECATLVGALKLGDYLKEERYCVMFGSTDVKLHRCNGVGVLEIEYDSESG